MHWLNYRYGLTGYLHGGFNAWTDDPINAPGQHRGDGWHVYPERDGLLNSLRLGADGQRNSRLRMPVVAGEQNFPDLAKR